MFEKDEYIVYGITGVCRVQDITARDQDGQQKLYYVLEPAGTAGGRIITPAEDNKSVMRRVLTEEEAYRYIQKCSMDNGTNMVETAQMILTLIYDEC